MKLVVVSDTHGSMEHLAAIRERHGEACFFHCGDACYPIAEEPDFVYVKGNCDRDRVMPEELITEQDGLVILQTHGDAYGVKQTGMRLRYRALEAGANLVLFGHTHVPTCVQDDGVLFLNPGSLLLPRSHPIATYAVLDGKTDGACITVEVVFYALDGTRQAGLGGTYRLQAAYGEGGLS
ncbi:hypothetical protein DFP93_10436 [Aneurinibacillus soli]|uniref:Phosphoesterase n=1 Tax=Aneurinibacillus soli TaxID=1500254 RepID=A0A0U4WDU1_9BACL|nr:metallophosphoesterase [Aneurinibacillus soli]PYE62390.1 hypothetical protein DFP93_10436 [Aneurinibacillus soli]BAU26953.1 hypothetical protein CB4_01122 [Aneurinibacillus soli]